MKIAEGIYTLEDILSPEECLEYIELTEQIGYEAAPITTARGFEIRPDTRNNTRVILDDVERSDRLWQRILEQMPMTVNGRKAVGLNERFRFYRYDPGERFAPHVDGYYRRENDEQSLLTLMVYLNEACEGGETNFLLQEVSVQPKTGMALIFDHQLFHEGAAVRSGRKYVLRSDVMFEPAYANFDFANS
jgi:prolyl 4-hydroxylase